MTLLSEYYVPGLHIEDRSIKVPLDWTGHEPGHGFDGESISLFYRVVTAPEHVHDDLPLLVFLQGGPGGSGPRPLGPSSDGWIEEAIKHFRVVLPDQRGTGRSSRVDTHVIEGMDGDGKAGAAFLKRFLADSIVRDFEHLRRTEFGGARWVTLGQSYGGFLTLTYLSLFPQGVIASFTTGGIPHVPADATDVYRHTFRAWRQRRSSSTSATRSISNVPLRLPTYCDLARSHCRTAIRLRWNASNAWDPISV